MKPSDESDIESLKKIKKKIEPGLELKTVWGDRASLPQIAVSISLSLSLSSSPSPSLSLSLSLSPQKRNYVKKIKLVVEDGVTMKRRRFRPSGSERRQLLKRCVLPLNLSFFFLPFYFVLLYTGSTYTD